MWKYATSDPDFVDFLPKFDESPGWWKHYPEEFFEDLYGPEDAHGAKQAIEKLGHCETEKGDICDPEEAGAGAAEPISVKPPTKQDDCKRYAASRGGTCNYVAGMKNNLQIAFGEVKGGKCVSFENAPEISGTKCDCAEAEVNQCEPQHQNECKMLKCGKKATQYLSPSEYKGERDKDDSELNCWYGSLQRMQQTNRKTLTDMAHFKGKARWTDLPIPIIGGRGELQSIGTTVREIMEATVKLELVLWILTGSSSGVMRTTFTIYNDPKQKTRHTPPPEEFQLKKKGSAITLSTG